MIAVDTMNDNGKRPAAAFRHANWAGKTAEEYGMVSILAFSLIVLAVFVVCLVAWRRREAEFEDQFPPISDEEFVSRCAPGTNPAVAQKVRRIVADCLCVDYERIYPSSRLVEDLGAE